MGECFPPPAVGRDFCSFRVQGRLYGIDVKQVREVSTHVACTPVPQAPGGVRGLTNLRSQIYLVLDVRPALGFPPIDSTSESRLIVLQPGIAKNLGLLVDGGEDIVRVPLEQIETTPADGRPDSMPAAPLASPVVGVCKLEGGLMMILDPTRLVDALQQALG